MTASDDEIVFLSNFFKNLINYKSDDPEYPINPINYHDPSGDNCLHIASRIGNYKAVQILLKLGLDINEKGDMGNTALHYACRKMHKEIIELLLDNGASVEIFNEFGKIPTIENQRQNK